MSTVSSWYALVKRRPSSYFQLKSHEKRLFKDQELLLKYKKSITEEVTSRDPGERCRREQYFSPHPVLNPNKLNKMRRVLNGWSGKISGNIIKKNTVDSSRYTSASESYSYLLSPISAFADSYNIESMFLQVALECFGQKTAFI